MIILKVVAGIVLVWAAIDSWARSVARRVLASGRAWHTARVVPVRVSASGLVKTAGGYQGWYNPSARSTWRIRLRVTADEAKVLSQAEINGKAVGAGFVDNTIELRDAGGGGNPIQWSVRRARTS